MAAAFPAPELRAPTVGVNVESLDVGDVVQLRSEAASKDYAGKNRLWTIVGVIIETTGRRRGGVVPALSRRYRLRSSSYDGQKVERETDTIEILPESVALADVPLAAEATIAPTDIPGTCGRRSAAKRL